MKYYMAPMEGLTGYVYRNAYHKNYGGVNRYFTPFITNKKLNHREINDIMPEHNQGMEVVPQILTNRAEDFLLIVRELQKFGYDKVNLNLGCPSGTVVAKNRGAGFLALPEELDIFLDEIFSKCPIDISIKTRIGKDDPEEWENLLAIYEKYPMEELIIHPRVQKDFYRNTVNMEAFERAAVSSRHSLCYNGDICTVENYEKIVKSFPKVEKVMIGRGVLKKPWLVQEIRDASESPRTNASQLLGTDADPLEEPATAEKGKPDIRSKERLRAYHDDILHGYLDVMSGDKNTLFKMKELWVYLGERFTNPEKYLKKMRKSERIKDYEVWVDALFREQELIGE